MEDFGKTPGDAVRATSPLPSPCGFVLLLRHGAIDRPEGTLVGQRDLPLSPLGAEQALSWRGPLAMLRPVHILCSPLARCRRTLDLALPGARAEFLPELAEISLGAWEGLGRAAVERLTPGGWEARGRDMTGYRPPGGESFADLQARAWPVVERLAQAVRQTGGSSLAVTHAGVIRSLLCAVRGRPLGEVMDITLGYGSMTIIAVHGEGFHVAALNLPPGTPLGPWLGLMQRP